MNEINHGKLLIANWSNHSFVFCISLSIGCIIDHISQYFTYGRKIKINKDEMNEITGNGAELLQVIANQVNHSFCFLYQFINWLFSIDQFSQYSNYRRNMKVTKGK